MLSQCGGIPREQVLDETVEVDLLRNRPAASNKTHRNRISLTTALHDHESDSLPATRGAVARVDHRPTNLLHRLYF